MSKHLVSTLMDVALEPCGFPLRPHLTIPMLMVKEIVWRVRIDHSIAHSILDCSSQTDCCEKFYLRIQKATYESNQVGSVDSVSDVLMTVGAAGQTKPPIVSGANVSSDLDLDKEICGTNARRTLSTSHRNFTKPLPW